MTDSDILRSFGYDPDDPVPQHEGDIEITDALLGNLHAAPLMPESEISLHVSAGRRIIARASRRNDPTENELMALRYLSRGCTVQQAADALVISIEAVKSRVKMARYKLGAKNVTHACCEAIRRGLIP